MQSLKKLLHQLVLNGGPADEAQSQWELTSALALWCALFFLISAVVVGRAAGAALFLNQYGGQALALVYVCVGVAVVTIIYGLSWLTHGLRYDRVAVGTIVTLGIGTAAFRLLVGASSGGEHRWLYGALYIFLETFALVTTMQVWTLANSLFTSAQAQRLYVFIATGGICGSLFGGLITRSLAMIHPLDLLWLTVAACPLMIVAVLVFKRNAKRLRELVRKEPTIHLGHSGRHLSPDETVRWIRHPVLRRRPVLKLASKLATFTFLTAVATNLIDFYFKTYADEHFHGDATQLARFFGNFFLSVGCFSLMMQVLVTPIIVRRSSPFGGLALTPLALSICTVFNLLGATIVRATVLKLLDSAFAHSVGRSCTEMLYTPLPPNLTGEVKLLSEGVAGRAGLVTAGLVLFVLAPSLTPARTLSLVCVLLVAWFLALLVLKKTYRVAASPPRSAALEQAPKRAA